MTDFKKYLVVKGHDDNYHFWTREEYDQYTRDCGKVGAGSAYAIVTHFDGTERLLSDQPTPDWQQSFLKEPVTFLLVNALKYLSPEQLISLRNALIERTPKEGTEAVFTREEMVRAYDEYESLKVKWNKEEILPATFGYFLGHIFKKQQK